MARRQLCAAAHNRLYVHRPIMCSGGVVIGVSPAMRPRGRCTAEHNRQLREDHRGRQRCEMQARPAGYCQAISQPVFGADALGFHEPVARIAVGGRPSPIDPRWPGYRRIDASPACSASRRLCAAVSAPKDALSRGNEFRSEPVVHNRTLNIEAVSRVGERRLDRTARAGPTGLVSSRRHLEPCMRFSRTRLSDVLHRRHSAPGRHGRLGRGATIVPARSISPMRSGD